MSDAETVTNLQLFDPSSTLLGRELRLQNGDILVGINGFPFHGDEYQLRSRLASSRDPSALSFLRDKKIFVVLSSTSRLGTWQAIPAIEMTEMTRINPATMVNWEIMRTVDGIYDIHSLSGNFLSLIAAPVWLLQMRLWIPAAAFIACAMVAVAVSPLMAMAVYLAAGLHIWSSGHKYFRKDRQSRGMKPHMVIAASSERSAHAIYKKLEPEARFLFDSSAPSPKPDASPQASGQI